MVATRGEKKCECVNCQLKPIEQKLEGVRERFRAPGVFEIMTADQWERFAALRERDEQSGEITAALTAQSLMAGIFGDPKPQVDPRPHLDRDTALLRDAAALADECEKTLAASRDEAMRRRAKHLMVQDAGKRVMARMDRVKQMGEKVPSRDRKAFRDAADDLNEKAEPMSTMRAWDEAVVDQFARDVDVMAEVLKGIGF